MSRLKKLAGIVAVASAAVVAIPAAPASALVVPTMSLTITPGATEHTVCASGSAASLLYVTGDWELTITGARATGSLPILQTASATSRTFSVCQSVPKFSSPEGQFWVTFEFAGVGSDVVGKWTGYGSWQPAVPDVTLALPL